MSPLFAVSNLCDEIAYQHEAELLGVHPRAYRARACDSRVRCGAFAQGTHVLRGQST